MIGLSPGSVGGTTISPRPVMAPCGYRPSCGSSVQFDEIEQLGAGDGRRHRPGKPELGRQRFELLAVTTSTGRVHQLVAQRGQHSLEAADLVQDGRDEDLDVTAAGGLRHPALADHRP
jgi:hypothetical protein